MKLSRLSKKRAVNGGSATSQTHELYLKINVNSAADLVPAAKESINPVCVVQLNNTKKRTHKKLNTSNPSWNSELLVPLKYNDYSQNLLLTVWDRHKRYKNYLGELRLFVKDLFLNEGSFQQKTELKWYSLFSSRDYQTFVTGSLLISFELVVKSKKTKKRDSFSKVKEKGQVSKDPKSEGLNVPKVKIDLFNQMDSLEIIESVTTPTDNELLKSTFEDWIKSLSELARDPKILKPDDQGYYSDAHEVSMGLDISDFESITTGNENPMEVIDLEPKKNDWLGVPDEGTYTSGISSDSENSRYTSVTESDAASAISKLVELPKKKLSKSRKKLKKKEGKFELSNRSVLGVLFVEIVSCSDLPPLPNFTRTSYDMDPFVVVAFGRKTFRTSWKRHTLNPIFNERLAFEILRHESNFNLQFSILDKDHFSFHDNVAQVAIPVSEIIDLSEANTPGALGTTLGATPADVLTPGAATPITHQSGTTTPSLSIAAATSTLATPQLSFEHPNKSQIEVIKDDFLVQQVTKKKFTQRKKVTTLYADTSKFKTLNLTLELEEKKYADKYNPALKVRVRFETYEVLRRNFWRALLEQYNLNDNDSKSYDYFELVSLLDTLGSYASDELVNTFFEKYGRLAWGGDVLDHEEIIDCLETHVSTNKDEENKIFEIDKCPLCSKKYLAKKQDIDIITHFAICTLKDWSIVNKLLVSSYVTPQAATKRWYSKFLIKLTYGKYKLGGNNANILVQDRTTGIILEEKMGIYVRLGIRLLYKGLDKAKTKRIRTLLKKLSVKQGVKFDSPQLKLDIESFIKFHKLNMDECLEPNPQNYATFNDFFYRKLKPDARPVESPTNNMILVSPADSRCATFSTVNEATELWIKGRNFTIARLFNGNFNNYEKTDLYKADKCTLGIFRLAPQDYHRFHCPVDGVIKNIKHINGEYYTVNPMAIRSELDVFGENIRVIIPIETQDFGTVIMIAVGAMMVGSTVLTIKEGDEVKRGDEIGYFKFGGSTIILLMETRFFEFDTDLLKNSSTRVETLVRVGQSIGHSPDIPEFKRDHIEFEKQSKDFKLNLIRVMTGGDLTNAHQLTSWESSNIKISKEDLADLADDDAEFDSDGTSFEEEGLIESE